MLSASRGTPTLASMSLAVLDAEQGLRDLAARLGHAFADEERLAVALTHRSFANERASQGDARGGPSTYNERLEFLGDSLLGAAAASLLFERFPDAHEGELTRRRSDLVCERTLAKIAGALGLGALLRLGRGE